MAPTTFHIPINSLAKRFSLIYILMALVLSVVVFAGVTIDQRLRIDNALMQERSRIAVAKARIIQDFHVVSKDLHLIANLPLMRSYLTERDQHLRIELEKLLLVFSQVTQRYDQIRFIDLVGQEDIRIDFNDGNPLITARANLQNKSKRYYFIDSIRLGSNEQFVSPLDLNIEKETVEIPYKPMIRYATPVFDDKGEKRGIIILNYFGVKLLDKFRAAMAGKNPDGGMLLTHDGYWLKGSKFEDEWGFMFNNPRLTFANRFPDAWPAIERDEQGSLQTNKGLFIYARVYPLMERRNPIEGHGVTTISSDEQIAEKSYHWKIVSFISNAHLYKDAVYNQPLARVLTAAMYFLLAVAAFFIARLTLSRQIANNEIVQLNNTLAQRVTEHAAGEENLAVTLRSIGDGVLTTDEYGKITRLNIIAEQLTGWSQSDAIGRPVAEVFRIVNQRTREPERVPVDATLASGVIHELHEDTLLLARDGNEYPIADSCAPIRNSAGVIIGTVLVFRDVTERKIIEQDLVAAKETAEHANLTKDAFLATMSHEIRTPLTGMLGMLEVLSMSELDNEQHTTLNVAWDSARNLLRIVNDVLDWSKIQDGKLTLSPQSTSIPQLLQEVINTYSRVASKKCLLLCKDVDPRLSAAHIVDPLRLSQILNNFVSNAIKFTHDGKVSVRAELLESLESGERIRFSVTDTGIGIPHEVQPNIFRRFQQESADTARQYGGTGLGLSICLRLAELLDGEIELVSEPDQGSTFSFTLILPISAAPGEKLPSLTPVVEQKRVAPLTTDKTNAPLILAVDDHPINRDLLERQIKLLGLNVESAENGLVALTKWKSGRFTLVITDCHMPEMDGYGFVRSMRRIEAEKRLQRTPVVAWTANARAEEWQFCERAGMDDLLVKPADLAQLKSVLKKWLHLDQRIDEGPINAGVTPVDKYPNSPIDRQELSKVVLDPKGHLEVLQEYQKHLVADLEKLDSQLAALNFFNIEQISHRMKGASKMVGATYITAACLNLEQAAKNKNEQDARIKMQQLADAITQFERYLLNGF